MRLGECETWSLSTVAARFSTDMVDYDYDDKGELCYMVEVKSAQCSRRRQATIEPPGEYKRTSTGAGSMRDDVQVWI